MTLFSDIDPELAADEALNAPEPDPLGLSDDDVTRRLRLLRFLRADRNELADRFDAELDRINEARDRHVGRLDLRIADVEATLTAWFEAHRANIELAGGRPPSSWVAPDGVLRSRRSVRVEHDLDAVGVAALPAWLTRTSVRLDAAAVKNAPRTGDGQIVDDTTGGLLPVWVVEHTNYRIETEETEDQEGSNK